MDFSQPQFRILSFQVSLLFLLGTSLTSSFFGIWAFAATTALFAATSAILARRLPKEDLPAACALILAFAAMPAAAYAMRESATSPLDLLYSFPLLACGFLAFFAVFKMFIATDFVRCTVLGYDNGLAIVRTEPSLSMALPPGRYVVESAKVAAGKKGRLVMSRSLFGNSVPKSLKIVGSAKKG